MGVSISNRVAYNAGMDGKPTGLCYLMQTLAWMGGGRSWTADVIAEQLGDFDDSRIHQDLHAAAELGLVVKGEDGYGLTDAGWLVAADETAS
jgi:hypothetical protein